jgi:FkbM family methyltransferase
MGMVPRVLHRVWLGPRPIPERYEAYWAAWKRQLPDYELVTWTEREAVRLASVAPLLERAVSPTQQADILRYAVLQAEGGVYMDCDMMPLQWRDWGLEEGLVTCNESTDDDIRSIGFIAAPKGNETFARALSLISATKLGTDAVNFETGPVLFRKAIAAEQRLPDAAFYPYHHEEPFSAIFERDLSATYGIHVWGMSWLGPDALADKARRWMQAGDIGAAEALARTLPAEPPAADIVEHCRRVRSIRTMLVNAVEERRYASAVDSGWLCGALIPAPAAPLPSAHPRFLDAAWHLLQQSPASPVWQIGAADGIVADPLRPLLINFDPPGMLVEPNPWIFSRLQQNYRNNARLTLVNAAVAGTAGKAELRAVVPEEVAARALPDWALGLSTFDPSANALGGKTVTTDVQRRLMKATRAVEVQTLTVADLLSQTGGMLPDIVVVDAAGMDTDIVGWLLDAGLRPRIVQLEVACVTEEQIAALKARLPADYVWIDLGEDAALYRRDFLDDLAREAYVEEGRLAHLARYRPDLLVGGRAGPR